MRRDILDEDVLRDKHVEFVLLVFEFELEHVGVVRNSNALSEESDELMAIEVTLRIMLIVLIHF